MAVTFAQFLSKLARGQLKNTNVTDDSADGLILPEKENQLLELTNQGLIDIFTRKKLKEGAGILTLVNGTNDFYLDPDTGDFTGLVTVLEIITGDERSHSPKTNKLIRMPDQYSIRFSDQFIEHYLNLGYPNVEIRFQQLHPTIALDGVMVMPAHLVEALVLYVSGLYLSHMGGEEHSKKGDSYYGLYLQMLTDDLIENRSGTSEVTDEDTRFSDRGFV